MLFECNLKKSGKLNTGHTYNTFNIEYMRDELFELLCNTATAATRHSPHPQYK